MKQRSLCAALAIGVAGLVAGGLSAVPASAATVVQVRPADLVTSLSDVRSAGHYDFLAEGIHVKTDDATSNAKVALYFPVTGAIPTTGSLEWYGTTDQPGAQIVFDKDQTTGNNNDNNILVGEQFYSTNPAGQPLTDWWYTGGTAKAVTRGITCPSTTGGSGSDCHGTLAQWAAALTTAKVYRRRLLDRQRRPGRRGPASRQPRSELVCLHRRTQGCGHRQGQGGQEHGQDRRQDQGHRHRQARRAERQGSAPGQEERQVEDQGREGAGGGRLLQVEDQCAGQAWQGQAAGARH